MENEISAADHGDNMLDSAGKQTPIEILLKVDSDSTVSSRNIYDFLELDPSNYSRWCKTNIVGNPFAIENIDYKVFVIKDENPKGGRPTTDYRCEIPFAKKLCMLEKNERGEQARDYFIKVEEKLKKTVNEIKRFSVEEILSNPESMIMVLTSYKTERDQRIRLEAINEQQQQQLTEQEPKVKFADAVEGSEDSILIRELAKLIRQNGVKIGGKRLSIWLRENGYLIKRKGNDYNLPTQYSLERGIIEIKESAITIPGGFSKITKTPYVTGKGQTYFVNKLLKAPEQLTLKKAAAVSV